jgi:hypothetical protein
MTVIFNESSPLSGSFQENALDDSKKTVFGQKTEKGEP